MIVLALILSLTAAIGQPLQAGPAVVFAVAPVYPQLAVLSATVGDVNVDVTIAADGRVMTARASKGHQLLNAAAEEAALKWRFEKGGDTRAGHLLFRFRIMPKGTPDSELTSSFSPPYTCEVRRTIPDIPPDRNAVTDGKSPED